MISNCRLFAASVVAVLVPIWVATGRALHRGWVPVGDNAYVAIRTYDVLGEHHPLVGMLSSARIGSETENSHPGPLLFDVLALPARLFGSPGGILVGVALVATLSVLGVAIFARRTGGLVVATAAMAVTAGLCWSFGSEVLHEPWNPYVALLPMLLFLVAAWAISCGDLVALPVAAAAGSFVVQANLSHLLVVPMLGASAVVVLALDLRRQRARDSASWPRTRRRLQRTGGLAGLVLVVCWIQPLIEQVTSDGTGNITRLVRALQENDATTGYVLGARVVASVTALPPWWVRPSFREAFDAGATPGGWRPNSAGVAALALLALAAVLGACAWYARRHRDRRALLAVGTAVIAVLAALAASAWVPTTIFANAAHSHRWLWPMAAFTFFAVAATVLRLLSRRGVSTVALAGGLAALTTAVAALNVPASNQGASAPPESVVRAGDLVEQLGSVEDDGTVLVEGPRRFNDPYAPAVMAELRRRGVPFVVDPRFLSPRQLGRGREFTGGNADLVLYVKFGRETLDPPEGTRRVGEVGLPAARQRELADLERAIDAYLRDHGLRLTPGGERALRDGLLPVLAGQSAQATIDPQALLDSGELAFMVSNDLVAVPREWKSRFERYAQLRGRWENETIALFVGSLPSGDPFAAEPAPGGGSVAT